MSYKNILTQKFYNIAFVRGVIGFRAALACATRRVYTSKLERVWSREDCTKRVTAMEEFLGIVAFEA